MLVHYYIMKENAEIKSLAQTLAAVTDETVMLNFLIDLCTPAELRALSDRWRVVPLLKAGEPYRVIYEKTGVSVTTVGRIARTIELGEGGYNAVYAARMEEQ